MVRMFAFFRQLYGPDRQLELLDALVEVLVERPRAAGRPPASCCRSPASSRLMKMFRWSRISLAESDTASRGVTEPLVHTSTVSLS